MNEHSPEHEEHEEQAPSGQPAQEEEAPHGKGPAPSGQPASPRESPSRQPETRDEE